MPLSRLIRLMATHVDVLSAINEMESLVQAETPDRPAVMVACGRLIETSTARRRLLDQEIYGLAEKAGDGLGHGVRDLRAADTASLALLSQYLATWTIDRVFDRWSEYQVTSVDIFRVMRNRIELEKSILYPLLGGELDGPTL